MENRFRAPHPELNHQTPSKRLMPVVSRQRVGLSSVVAIPSKEGEQRSLESRLKDPLDSLHY